MLLQGSQRGGTHNLALHLLKDENEHVSVHELRGFVSDDLVSAFAEINAVSKGTKAKQPVFSLSLNPPPGEHVSTESFMDAIQRVEKELNLENQPRAIVFHEKEGRRHCHAVWSRIDAQEMKAIPLPYTKYKLRDLSRDLYIEHNWKMPQGYINSKEKDPKNFTLAEWQQAKRAGKDPRAIIDALRDSWAVSDSQNAFQHALKERGYILAKGDRRGFVAIDHRCEVYAIGKKWMGIDAKSIRQKLTDNKSLPSVDEAKQQIAKEMSTRMAQLQRQQQAAIQNRVEQVAQKYRELAIDHKQEREALKNFQEKRWFVEAKQRQERHSNGLRGLLERFTGKHNLIKKENEMETLKAFQRDQRERDVLIFKQMEQRQNLKSRLERLLNYKEQEKQMFKQDVNEYKTVIEKKQEKPELHKNRDTIVKAFRNELKQNRSILDFRDKIQTDKKQRVDRDR